MTKETAIQRKILAALRKLEGGRFFKVHQSGYSEAGISDIIGCYRGCFVALEVKTPIGKPTSKQTYFLNQIESCGGYSAVVRSVSDAMEIIHEIEQGAGA